MHNDHCSGTIMPMHVEKVDFLGMNKKKFPDVNKTTVILENMSKSETNMIYLISQK
jgi:hypothetical protein